MIPCLNRSLREAEAVAKDLTASLLRQGAFEDISPSTVITPVSAAEIIPALAENVVEAAGVAVRAVGASDIGTDGLDFVEDPALLPRRGEQVARAKAGVVFLDAPGTQVAP